MEWDGGGGVEGAQEFEGEWELEEVGIEGVGS
jgi:hypothetical protein